MVGSIRDDDDPAQDFENQKAFTPFTAAWNVTGMPAVSLPTGWSSSGLPIGTMLAGQVRPRTTCSTPSPPRSRPPSSPVPADGLARRPRSAASN